VLLFGASAGAVAAWFLIFIIFFLNKRKIKEELQSSIYIKESNKDIVRKLLSIAIPITIGASIVSLMGFDWITYIVSNRLSTIGYSSEQILICLVS